MEILLVSDSRDYSKGEIRSLTLYYILLALLFSLSTLLLWYGILSYLRGMAFDAIIYIAIGFSGVASSLWLLGTLRRRIFLPLRAKFRLVTMTECKKCGFKRLRPFKSEDYVFKRVEECPKCNRAMFISSIFHKSGER